jgi:hypothetical protein
MEIRTCCCFHDCLVMGGLGAGGGAGKSSDSSFVRGVASATEAGLIVAPTGGSSGRSGLRLEVPVWQNRRRCGPRFMGPRLQRGLVVRVAYSVSLSSPNMLCLVTSRSYFSEESSLSMMTESWPSYWYLTKTSTTLQGRSAAHTARRGLFCKIS